jgi:hypothetical protein
MVEIHWKSEGPHAPVRDHEFYELRLFDFGEMVAPRFVVREIHGLWSASAQQIQWKGYQDETCRTSDEANRRLGIRRASIVDEGFAYTTLVE